MTEDEYTGKSFMGAFSLLRDMGTGALKSKVDESRKDVLNTQENGWTVDTCCAFDSGKWETGIEGPTTDGNFHIAEQYKDRDEAEKGHEKWVAFMRENPNREIPNINVWETMEDDDF